MTPPQDDRPDRPVNAPRAVPRRDVDPPPPRPRPEGPAAAGDAGREGDTGLGRRSPPPSGGRQVTDDELEAIDARERAELEAELGRAAGLRLPEFLFSTTFVLAVAALGALVVLLVIGQVVELGERMTALPDALRWTGWSALALLLAVVAAAAVRLLLAALRLRRVGQVDLRALSALAERSALRGLARSRLEAAVARLEAYLRDFPVDGEKAERELLRAGFDAGEIETLRARRRELLDRDRHPGAEAWLDRFASGFQGVLDGAARRRVARSARLVAAKTAVTPRSVDTAIVLHAALTQVADLCRIYRLRLGGLGAAVVLGRAFALAYLGGQLQQAAETVTREAAADGAGQLLEGLPEGVGEIGSQLAGALAPKIAEGAANGILLWRLGAATIRLLRPVAAPTRRGPG